MKETQRFPFWGIILGLGSIVIRSILSKHPVIIENYYSRGIFLPIRIILDSIHQILPFSSVYLLIVLLGYLIYRNIRIWRLSSASIFTKTIRQTLGIFSFLGWIIFLFLSLWGFNYARIPIEQQLNFTPTPLPLNKIKIRLSELTPLVLEHRKSIKGNTPEHSFNTNDFPLNMTEIIRSDLESVLTKFNFNTDGFPTIRLGYPKGVLWGFGAAGFYNPFTGECNVDPALHAIDLPFVIAHEYGHAYGFGDEGTCNFLAYLACMSSKDPFIRYSGIYNYWQYLYYELRKADPEYFKMFYDNLPLEIKTDQTSIVKNGQKYPYFIPDSVHKATYDAYLKTQGVKEGFASYHKVIMFIEGWNLKQKEMPH